MPSTFLLIYQAVALACAFVGCVLIWRFGFSSAARAERKPSPLPHWDITWPEFIIFAIIALSGYVFGGWIGFILAKALKLSDDAQTIVGNAGAQLGMLVAIAGIRGSLARTQPPRPKLTEPGIVLSGAATFLITMPVVMLVTLLSETCFRALGLPVVRQDSVAIFMRSDSPWLGFALGGLAVGIAPITEELAFRAGLFRFLRTRLSPVLGVLLPAIVFASLHISKNLAGLSAFPPLVALAVVFSLAYQRTGRIGTTMVAHALFNLNSILFILCGGGKEP